MGPTPLRPLQGIIGCCLRNLRNGERKGQEMGGEKAKSPAWNGGGRGIFFHKKQGHLL